MGGSKIMQGADQSYDAQMQAMRRLVSAEGLHVDDMADFECVPLEDKLHFDRRAAPSLVTKVFASAKATPQRQAEPASTDVHCCIAHSTLSVCQCLRNSPHVLPISFIYP